MRMQKRHWIIIALILLFLLSAEIWEYVRVIRESNRASAVTVGVPNPGHAWSSMECSSDTLCVDTTNKFVGIGTNTPAVKLDVAGNVGVTGNITTGGVVKRWGLRQPDSASAGAIRYNSTSKNIELCNGSLWTSPSFACGTPFTDSRNSKTYNTVLIGSQCWMKENLDYDNGCSSKTWVDNTDVGWCGYYTGGPFTNEGLLYQWSAAMATTSGTPGICPLGWHVPSHDEFTTLERAVCTSETCATDFPYDNETQGDMGTDEGSKLSTLTSGGTNSSGFTALLPGCRSVDGSFNDRSSNALLWSKSAYDSSSAWFRFLTSGCATVIRLTYSEAYAFSVRCLKD